MVLIGYSGHAFVAADILSAAGKAAGYYCDMEEKEFNPFNLLYLGTETSTVALEKMRMEGTFIAIGDNYIRAKIYSFLVDNNICPKNAIHPTATISQWSEISAHGIMIAAGVIVNPLVQIENGVILNSGSIIEHECLIGSFSHVGPGTILCGNVIIGERSFIGAGSVVRQGIRIGNNVVVGAGATVVKDIPDNTMVMGNPAK